MEQVWLLATVQERIPRRLVDMTRILERSAKNKWECFFHYYFFECNLKVTLTAGGWHFIINTLRETRIQNLWFVAETTSIPDRFIRSLPQLLNITLSKAVLQSIAHAKLVILWISDTSTQYIPAEMIYIELIFAKKLLFRKVFPYAGLTVLDCRKLKRYWKSQNS